MIVNYDNVRPSGERLKVFGGRASGYESIQEMFDGIYKVITKNNSNKKQLSPVDCMDIANLIGVNVRSGGTRRSSEIVLFDADDKESFNAKGELYKIINGEWTIDESISHRTMSNNSVFYETKPTKEEWHKHVEAMRFSGEPGFVNAEASRKRRDNYQICNPLT